jgi:hypothetical protein
MLKQAQSVTQRFSETLEVLTATSLVHPPVLEAPYAQTNDMSQDNLPSYTNTNDAAPSIPLPILEAPYVQINDVDKDDLPSSRGMDIDDDDDDESAWLDEEGSIASGPVDIVDGIAEDKEDEIAFVKVMDAAAQALLDGIDLEDIEKPFDFLSGPDSYDMAEGEAGPGPSNAPYRQSRRTLLDDEEESRTYQWHSSAGRVYRHEPTVHDRLQSQSSNDAGQEYKPFCSRLDWEIAQWAVKEKIHQKSFDRLLKIPQVLFLSAIE